MQPPEQILSCARGVGGRRYNATNSNLRHLLQFLLEPTHRKRPHEASGCQALGEGERCCKCLIPTCSQKKMYLCENLLQSNKSSIIVSVVLITDRSEKTGYRGVFGNLSQTVSYRRRGRIYAFAAGISGWLRLSAHFTKFFSEEQYEAAMRYSSIINTNT